MISTFYRIKADTAKRLRIALAADLHDEPYDKLLTALADGKPDIIAAAGDIYEGRPSAGSRGIRFLRHASEIAPVFYAPGNHEKPEDGDRAIIESSVSAYLDNSWTGYGGFLIGGLSSGFENSRVHKPQGIFRNSPAPDTDFLARFAAAPGFHILISHHPEYYPEYIRSTGIELILSGHAHGGQWRLFGKGIFAPGQGLFPKYTSGVHDGRLVISRGLAGAQGYLQ